MTSTSAVVDLIGTRLITALQPIRLQPQTIVADGLACPEFSGYCQQRWPGHQRYTATTSPTSVDFWWSHLQLATHAEWDDHLSLVADKIAPEGLLMFSTLGSETLVEWQRACNDGFAHCNPYVDMHHIGDWLIKFGLQQPVLYSECLTLLYRDVQHFVTDLRLHRALGLTFWAENQKRSLTTPRQWQRYAEQLPRNDANELMMTVEVVYGHAWRITPTQQTVTWYSNKPD